MNKVTTTNKQFRCDECSNEVTVPDDKAVGDYFECEFCGIEYEVVEKTAEGEFVVQIVEEEK